MNTAPPGTRMREALAEWLSSREVTATVDEQSAFLAGWSARSRTRRGNRRDQRERRVAAGKSHWTPKPKAVEANG